MFFKTKQPTIITTHQIIRHSDTMQSLYYVAILCTLRVMAFSN